MKRWVPNNIDSNERRTLKLLHTFYIQFMAFEVELKHKNFHTFLSQLLGTQWSVVFRLADIMFWFWIQFLRWWLAFQSSLMSHAHFTGDYLAPPIWATLQVYQISSWLNFVPLGYTLQPLRHNNGTATVTKCRANKGVSWLTGLLWSWRGPECNFFCVENKAKLSAF